MDYEKKYKEALERMKSWARGEHPKCFSEAQKAAEFIFPELKESEDERIRKALVRFHKSTIDVDGIKGEDIIAWLEKQGEQKPFDYENANIQQTDFAPKAEQKSAEYNEDNELSCFESALFTAFSDAWQSYLLGEKVNVKQWAKEHSKELLEAAKEELKEQKPAWSEEDESIVLGIEQLCNCASLLNIAPDKIDKIRTWLKSLRPQNRWKPSNEQMKVLLSEVTGWTKGCPKQIVLESLYNDLKKLKEIKL